MGSVNVNRSVSDQFYRYKMPKLIAKVEGKGNGIKTVIVNMVEIAKSLNRPPMYPTKFFGCEIGAQTQFDQKNERYIVNGSHDAHKLQDMLDGFIKKFVLCPECGNPETNLVVSQKRQMVNQQCIACGYQGPVDQTHKLIPYILKNPPDAPPAIGTSAVTSITKDKTKSKKNQKKNGDGDKSPTANEADDGFDTNGFSNGKSYDDDDDDWAVDTSEDAVAKRMEILTEGAKVLTLTDDLEKTQQERLELLFQFVKRMKDNGKLDGGDKDIVTEAERLEIKDKGPLVLSEVLFDENILHQIKQHRILFLRFTHGNAKAQKYLLGGVEQVVKAYKDSLMPKVGHIMKLLYDTDIVDEEVIIDWSKKVSKKYVPKEVANEIHDKAAPFIKWLKEAEEEESSDGEDDEEDEEEVEVVYSDRAAHALQEERRQTTKNAVIDNNDEDEIDIDAI
jgi:translation initiation factor 5